MMNKKSLAILLVASTFASSTFATSIINKLITKHHSTSPSIVKTHKISKHSNQAYTDFTGTWVGKCNDSVDMSMTIENDAEYISFNGDESRIGMGLQGTFDSSTEDSQYSHLSMEWNADSSLSMKAVDVSKGNMDNSPLVTTMAQGSLAMKSGQLNLDVKMSIFADMEQAGQPIAMHCGFVKKQQ